MNATRCPRSDARYDGNMPDWILTLLAWGLLAIVVLVGLAVLAAPLHLWLQWESERTIKKLRGD